MLLASMGTAAMLYGRVVKERFTGGRDVQMTQRLRNFSNAFRDISVSTLL